MVRARTTPLRTHSPHGWFSPYRHVKWVDLDSHGHGVLDVTAERSRTDSYVVSDRTREDATSTRVRSYRTRGGTRKVERVDAPVR